MGECGVGSDSQQKNGCSFRCAIHSSARLVTVSVRGATGL
jgi:hypothetical protein